MQSKTLELQQTLCFGHSLFEGRSLAGVERILHEEAAQWSRGLHIYREGDKRLRRAISHFPEDVTNAALERGEAYAQAVARHGVGEHSRRFGSVELRGDDDPMVIVISLDEQIFSPSAGRYLWGNTISLQIRVQENQAQVASAILRAIAERAAAELPVWYAHGHTRAEWEAKNMSREGGGLMRIGGDVSRYLPGLYWLNFYGKPYVELMGRGCLLSAPAYETKVVGDGVLALLSEQPTAWGAPQYGKVEEAFLDHVGRTFFFSQGETTRDTMAPDFGLSPLVRHPRFS